MSADLNHWRNRVAVPVANWVLDHVATPAYRDRVDELVRVGIQQVYGVPAPATLDVALRALQGATEAVGEPLRVTSLHVAVLAAQWIKASRTPEGEHG
jgi:hypothetical protein